MHWAMASRKGFRLQRNAWCDGYTLMRQSTAPLPNVTRFLREDWTRDVYPGHYFTCASFLQVTCRCLFRLRSTGGRSLQRSLRLRCKCWVRQWYTLVRHPLFHLLITCDVILNADALFDDACFAFLSSCLLVTPCPEESSNVTDVVLLENLRCCAEFVFFSCCSHSRHMGQTFSADPLCTGLVCIRVDVLFHGLFWKT